jgi:threonine dehydrogenase-like Zn-dependent dehydrogenase
MANIPSAASREPEFTVKVDPSLGLLAVLMEPTSIVAKAWNQIDRIGQRSGCISPRTVLVTGAGPVGFLAALLGKQRGLEVHIFDRAESGHKPELAHALGAHYHHGAITDLLAAFQPDIMIECTAAMALVAESIGRMAPNGTICLTGVTAKGRKSEIDLGLVNRNLVLDNQLVFGTVNANRTHYEAAARALATADRRWLERLISRRVPLARWQEALENRPGDVKVVIDFSQ